MTQTFAHTRGHPHWRAYRHMPPPVRPARSIANWLLDRGSLTARLKARYRHFQVQLDHAGNCQATANESRLMQIPLGRLQYVRCVHLIGDGQAVVTARTIIPRTTLTGPVQQLTRLGTRPLGEAVFTFPNMHRGPIQIARLQPGQWPFRHLREPAWGRRSVFYLAGMPLMVYEVFLNALWR